MSDELIARLLAMVSEISDAVHKIVENTEMDKTITRYQYEQIEDQNSRMAKIGYTADEVTKILEG